jgi:hypothetical protein
MNNWELNRELAEHKKERSLYESELSQTRNNMAHMLLNEMGKDINDVLSGKVQVKLTWKEKIKYKLKFIIDKLFSTI